MKINKKRIFIALPLTREFKERLREAVFGLKRKYPEWRWLPEENWHITLVPPNNLDEVEIKQLENLIETELNFKKFVIESDGIVLGPLSASEKSMVWLNFKHSPDFFNLRKGLNGLSDNLANIETRPGKIHVTLARFKNFNKSSFEEEKFQQKLSAGRIELWESRLFNTGSIFSSLASIDLL